MYQAVIIDDDNFSHEVLKDLLEKYFPEYRIAGNFYSVKDSVKSLDSSHPDILFLDIELPDGKGFDVLEKLDKIDFEVIITTVHDSYMLQAIKHSAIDYLMKPIEKKSLTEALQRFEKKMAVIKKQVTNQPTPRISKLALPTHDGLVLVEISEMVRLESEGAYTKFITTSGEVLMTSKSIGSYEDQLSPHGFFRIHHSHLINLSHIRRYVKGEGGYVIMSDNSNVDVARRKKEEFIKSLGI